jgi:hypothetical protein
MFAAGSPPGAGVRGAQKCYNGLALFFQQFDLIGFKRPVKGWQGQEYCSQQNPQARYEQLILEFALCKRRSDLETAIANGRKNSNATPT